MRVYEIHGLRDRAPGRNLDPEHVTSGNPKHHDRTLMAFYVKREPNDRMPSTPVTKAEADVYWGNPPELMLRTADDNKKSRYGKPRVVPDMGHCFGHNGALICSQRTVDTIGDFLKRFGLFYEIQIEGEPWYVYMVTNVLEGVVDLDNSHMMGERFIHAAAFYADKMPHEPQIFKVPEDQLLRIYFIDPEQEGVNTLKDKLDAHELEAGDLPLVWDSGFGAYYFVNKVICPEHYPVD